MSKSTRTLFTSLLTSCLVGHFGLILVNGEQSAWAQITLDRSTATEVNGNVIAPVGSGTVSGGNLYHSFDQFNVPQSGVTFGTGNSTVDGGKINNILNRVTGDNPSQVLGTIESRTAFPNANLYLMNPNGVVFGKDARLDIGGSFHVNTGTSLGFAGDRSFSADKANLEFPSGDPKNIKFGISQPAAIINQGNLTVDAGKSITFTAGSVINSGILTAPGGNVAVTAVTGGSVVNLRSPDLVLGLSVAKNAVPTDWNGEIASLPKLAELLTGKVEQGDRVVVKPDGTLAIVTTPTNDQLPITNGTTVISGTINTSSANANGGNVGVFGDRVAIVNSQISTTGINGGKVLIGGDLQGNGSVPNAEFTYFDRKSVVDVSALESGDGGLVIVWGDLSTRFFGLIVANAGNVSGDGGFVEVSGKRNLDYGGAVSTLAPNGNLGTLLLDPTDITLVAGGGFFAALTDVDNFADPNGTVNTLNVGLINNALSNVVLQATNNINIDQPINITGLGISFTAQAGNNINVNENITTNRGSIALLANNGATATGTGSIQSTGTNISIVTNGANFTATGFNFSNVTTINTTSSTGGGNIDINVTGAINANPSTLLSSVAGTGTGNAGNITLRALGNIQASALQAADLVGATVINGGNVTVDAGGDITIGTLGSISTRSTSGGKAGEVLLKSGGSITALGTTGINTSVIGSSFGGSQAGNVTFQAGTTINTDAVIGTSINSNTVTGNAGNITFTAGGNISATGDLIAANLGTGNAGKIDVTSTSGSITNGNIVTSSLVTASDVTLRALNNITTGYILGIGGTQGSNVSLTATNGNVAISTTGLIPSNLLGVNLDPCVGSNICTTARNGISGNITIAGNLSLTNATKLLTTGTPTGGAINLQNANINGTQNLTLDSGNGAINLGNIGANTGLGTLTINAGSILANQAIAANSISFTTTGNLTVNKIQTNLITTNAGNIILNSGGSLTLNGDLDVSSTTGTSGLISLTAVGDIFANGGITFDGRVLGGRDSQPISITSQNGNITGSGLLDVITTARNAGAVTFKAANSILFRDIKTDGSDGTGGNVTIAATTGSITGNTILATSQGISTGSGNVSLTAARDIAIKQINSNTQNGKAGDISVKTALSSGINGLTNIQANSLSGQGGNITIESGSTLPNAGFTILAGGAIAGSTIDLRTASLLIGGDLIIDSPNSDILLGETSVQPSNFEIRNARNVTLSQRLLAEKVDITNTGILKFTDANTLIESPIFQQQSASEVQLAGEINGTTITFNSPVVLTGTAILTASDFGANQGTIAFNSTLSGGGRNLKLSANEIDFGSNVSGINALTLAPSSPGVNIQLGGTNNVAGTFTLTQNDLINVQAGGLGSLIIGGDYGAEIRIVSSIPTFLQKTTFQADGFGDVDFDTTGQISQGSIIALTPVATNGSDTITFIASQNVNISDVINAGKDIIVTSTNANVTTGRLNTATSSVLPSGNVTVTASKGSVTVSSIVTQSPNSKAGDVTIQALNNIQTTDSTIINRFGYAIASFAGAGNGGNISLTSDAGAIDVSSGLISTATTAGISGSINFRAFGNIITGAGTTPNPAVASFVTTGGTGTPNSITFTSSNGAINTSLGDVDAGGGAIAFTALNNITTSGVFSRAINGGSVKLESRSGAIDSTAGDLTTSTLGTGTGGTINLIASGNITTRGIFTNGNNGSITIQSNSGGINTSLNDLASTGSNNNIALTALQNIVTRSIFAQGDRTNIAITSTGGNVDLSLGFIQTGIDASQTGSGGALTIKSAGNILTGDLNAPNLSSSVGNVGSVSLTSDTGSIAFTGISARRANGNGNGGTVNIQANGNITSTGVVSFAGVPSIFSLTTGVFSVGNGGTVTLTSTNGSIDTRSGTVSTSSTNGTGGNIAFTSNTGAIATGNLLSNGTTQGGNILIDARTQIDVGRVSSSSSQGGGGNVTLDPIGNVTFTTIDATGNTTLGASGGNVNIVSTGGNVLGTGQLIDSLGICIGATICTNGTGTVSIQHGITSPFNLNAFLVGGAITNGTFGTINVGGLVIGAIAIPNPAGSFVQGNLTVTPGGIPSTTPIATVPVIEFSGIKESRSEVPRDRSRPTVDTSDVDRDRAGRALEIGDYGGAFDAIESAYISAYENYLGETLTLQVKNIEQLQQELDDVSKLSGSVTTAVYPIIMGDRLELLIIPPKGMSKPFREFVADAKQSAIMPVIMDFANNIRDTGSEDYMEQSQQLYNWLVRPYRDRLQALQEQYQKSDLQANPKQSAPKPNPQAATQLPPTLVFVMDGGLRVIPVAALHDGKRFLIEEYALANLPYLRATRLEKRDRTLNNVLAMGLTESVQGFSALPGVRIEVSTISSQVLKGNSYFDQEFTVDNLQEKRRQGNYGVLHLATHAQFLSDDSKGAFIQFWNERLSIDRIPKLRFDNPLIEMLTLSACQTAVGQNLGLGGLAVSSGAKSVLASLWEVSDTGTAPLMIQFYNSFPENITKAIALQRSQIGMISGGVTIKDGKIIGIPNLPPISLAKGTESNISIQHPYFWSSFILIGNWL